MSLLHGPSQQLRTQKASVLKATSGKSCVEPVHRGFSASMESYMFWTSRHLLEDLSDTSDGRNPEAFSTAPSRDFGRSSLCSESHELVRTPARTTIFNMRTKFGLRGESQRISTRTVEVTHDLDRPRQLPHTDHEHQPIPRKSIEMSRCRNSK